MLIERFQFQTSTFPLWLSPEFGNAVIVMEQSKRVKLVKILGLLSSPSDGEALSAARRADALLKTEKSSWEALIMGKSGSLRDAPHSPRAKEFDWMKMMREIMNREVLSEWKDEIERLLSLYQRGGRLSEAQMRIILNLYTTLNRKR